MKVKDIKIGKRHRQDVGDLRSLAASIQEVGLLHPVVVDANGRLVAGARRLAACQSLGWVDIPTRVVRSLADAAMALKAERDENTQREPFKPSDAVAVARALEPFERREAKRRQAGSAKSAEPGEARQKVAAVVGKSHETLRKASAVVEAAEREPDRFERLRQQMDRTGNISGAFKALNKQRQADQIAAEPPPLPPTGPFRVIVADPPWTYDDRPGDITHRGSHGYPDMSTHEICGLPVNSLAATDALLWLWTTNAHLRESYDVLDAWGFESKTLLTWAKSNRFGTGQWLRGQTEHCHLAVRGKPTILLTNQSTLLLADTTRSHSEKPDTFYQLVEALCPGSKVELFARRTRNGWSSWGNEIPSEAATG